MTVSFIQDFRANVESFEVFQKVGQFTGHIWKHIKNFSIYAEDPYIAYPSLIIANVVIFQIAKFATWCFQYCFCLSEERSEGNQTTIDGISMLIGYGIAIGGIAFLTKAQLPLSPYVIVGVSIMTLAICILLEHFIKS